MGGREVNMGVDVAQEQLQRIPAGPQNLMAEKFELVQRTHNYVVGYNGVQQGVRQQARRPL
jgi:hypothetical protein